SEYRIPALAPIHSAISETTALPRKTHKSTGRENNHAALLGAAGRPPVSDVNTLSTAATRSPFAARAVGAPIGTRIEYCRTPYDITIVRGVRFCYSLFTNQRSEDTSLRGNSTAVSCPSQNPEKKTGLWRFCEVRTMGLTPLLYACTLIVFIIQALFSPLPLGNDRAQLKRVPIVTIAI